MVFKRFVRSAAGIAGLLSILSVLSGCQGGSEESDGSGILGTDIVTGNGVRLPIGVDTGGGGNGEAPSLGDSCQDGSDKICLGLKYVAFNNGDGQPVVAPAEAVTLLRGINSVWAQCGIGFQIDHYVQVNPGDYGLEYNIANYGDLDTLRNALQDDDSLLVVTTGSWNRSGSLGSTGANAWANMPGFAPYGVILESTVGTFANIVAHELGHYLNLDHYNDSSDLMNPTIYDGSTSLTKAQCNEARSASNHFWQKMLR